jgi:hypothetical protein
VNYIFKNEKILIRIIDLFQKNYTLLVNFSEIFSKDLKADEEFAEYLTFILGNGELINITISIIKGFVDSYSQSSRSIDFIGNCIRYIFKVYSDIHNNTIWSKVSGGCIDFLNYTLLGYIDNKFDRNISYYYIYKFLQDSSKGKNNLLNYENCLFDPPIFKNIPTNISKYMENSPAFALSIVDLTNNTNVKKNNTVFEEYRYIFGACVPKGEGYYSCNHNDYKYFIGEIIHILYNVDNVDIIPIEITQNKNSNITFRYLIPFFILIIILTTKR